MKMELHVQGFRTRAHQGISNSYSTTNSLSMSFSQSTLSSNPRRNGDVS